MKTLVEEIHRRGMLGADWLARQVDPRGNLSGSTDLGCYYKCVYPLRLAGYPAEAARLLDRIMERHYRPDGDLRNSDEQRTSGTYTSWFSQVYPIGWIIQGAFLAGRFDVVRKLLTGVMNNFYDADLGTFRCSYRPKLDIFDVNSAAMALELFLLSDLAKARAAADFLVRLIENQPDPDHWFYSRVDRSFHYLTTPDPRSETYSAVKIGAEKQANWFLGLPCAALVQFAEYTGETRYLRAAQRFFDTFLACGDPSFRWVTSGKSLWAAGMLYRITGDEKYLNSINRLTEFFFSLQRDDGLFLMPSMTAEAMGAKLQFDVTPEYIRWFLDTAADLGVRQQ